MKTILINAMIGGSLLFSGCGIFKAENQTNSNSNAAGNREQTGKSNANINADKSSETSFALPSPRPIENGKPQSVGGITVTVPADWKKVDQKEGWAKFVSPDKIELYLNRSYDLQERDLMAEFIKLRRENPTYKTMTRAFDGELGILYLAEKYNILNGDVINWTTFPPPDARNYAVKRSVMIVCPSGTYEQNKQIMFDILFTVKLQR